MPTKYELPRDVVFEGIVNAICHRDYASTASVEVRVFSDRVEVWNPGELPPGKTVAWLFDEHESMPFNPWISARGAAEMLGLTQQGVQYHLARLSSVLHHEGGDKGGRWVLGPKPKGKGRGK